MIERRLIDLIAVVNERRKGCLHALFVRIRPPMAERSAERRLEVALAGLAMGEVFRHCWPCCLLLRGAVVVAALEGPSITPPPRTLVFPP